MKEGARRRKEKKEEEIRTRIELYMVFASHLQDDSDQDCHHDQGVDCAEDLGHKQLDLGVEEVADNHETQDWDQVPEEGRGVGDAKSNAQGT